MFIQKKIENGQDLFLAFLLYLSTFQIITYHTDVCTQVDANKILR